MLNHFNFKRIDQDTFLLTNDFGQYVFLDNDEFSKLISTDSPISHSLKETLEKKRFLVNPYELFSEELITDLRGMKNYLFSSTSLHIFVITNICNHRCAYCQAQANSGSKSSYMTADIGRRAINIALQSPSQKLVFEFQGGEPLLNFSVLREMIEYTETVKGSHDIEYSIVSNLSVLDDEMVDFLVKHHVSISTSIDGPKELHNKNRVSLCKQNSYELAIAGISKIRDRHYDVGAIQTTTRDSLYHSREIIEEYYNLGLHGVFLRPLTRLGYAKAKWYDIGYSPEDYLTFYKQAFSEVLEINKKNGKFPELYASYFLKKIFSKYSYNYMELRSPCGAGIGQIAYYYDGKIYTCDEARMVGEMGDDAFCIGDVYTSRYQDLIISKPCAATTAASIIETIPGCCDCVYQPYCGVCPVVNYATDNDVFSKSPRGFRCKVNMGILDYLFEMIRQNNSETINILKSWIEDDM